VPPDPAGTGMPTYRDVYREEEEVPVQQPTLEDLFRPESVGPSLRQVNS